MRRKKENENNDGGNVEMGCMGMGIKFIYLLFVSSSANV